MLFENSKQKLNSNQTTEIMKIIYINKIFGTKNMQQNTKYHHCKSDFVQKHM